MSKEDLATHYYYSLHTYQLGAHEQGGPRALRWRGARFHVRLCHHRRRRLLRRRRLVRAGTLTTALPTMAMLPPTTDLQCSVTYHGHASTHYLLTYLLLTAVLRGRSHAQRLRRHRDARLSVARLQRGPW